MQKDRAAPFSRKHIRYWVPVTGGMILIGAINVGLGVCTYKRAGDSEPIHLDLVSDAGLPGQVGLGTLPADVMREFATRYPRILPAAATVDSGANTYTLMFPAGAAKRRATFRSDGTFVSDE